MIILSESLTQKTDKKASQDSDSIKSSLLRNEGLIIPESMAQYFGFTAVLGKQAHSRLRNWFSSAAVESKDKSDSGIIEFSFLNVEVAFAIPEYQQCIAIKVAGGTTVEQAINESGIVRQFSEIDLAVMPVGIFAKVCRLDKILEHGDRVEIYRPLKQNPMDARRNRAGK